MAMAASTFKTNPVNLEELLKDCHHGILQLPDFQRSWVWEEERVRSLIASVSRAFPIGALMALETRDNLDFKPRLIEGAPKEAASAKPRSLLLDGQQRMTSLYQVAMRGHVVETMSAKNKRIRRWFYIDIRKAIDNSIAREAAIMALPEDKLVRVDFGREIQLDLRTREDEFETLMFPLSMIFEWGEWHAEFMEYAMNKGQVKEHWDVLRQFKSVVIDNFNKYQVPVITLDAATSKEAVCVVFEKVNTGGKALDAFELVTAMYAAHGHELRRDWYGNDREVGRQKRLASVMRAPGEDKGILAEVSANRFSIRYFLISHPRTPTDCSV